MTQSCDTCHTMHNSQLGAPMVQGGLGAQDSLLTDTCYGCHTGVNGAGSVPYVIQTGAPSPLAGGSFYWVSTGLESQGHNVEGVIAQVSRIPPGGTKTFDTLTCAGVNGCHGDKNATNEIGSIARSHHTNGNPGLVIDGLSVAASYRFLDGIIGLEDDDWERTVGPADHNQYKGFARNLDTSTDAAGTISSLCARCHGFFHSGPGDEGTSNGVFGTDPWIRHPVDYDMFGLGGEYDGYGGAGHTYNVQTPLGSDVIGALPKSTVLAGPGDAIIVCVSCHRAHGSPNPSSLRWDYQSWPGGGYNGCGDCHTSKN